MVIPRTYNLYIPVVHNILARGNMCWLIQVCLDGHEKPMLANVCLWAVSEPLGKKRRFTATAAEPRVWPIYHRGKNTVMTIRVVKEQKKTEYMENSYKEVTLA